MIEVDVLPEAVLDLVRESLAIALDEQLGEILAEIEILQIAQRPYSLTVFLAAHTDLGRRRFVMKQIVKHPLNDSIVAEPEQALVEYNLLTQLYFKFAEVERCSVPRPIVALPEIDAFIMEHVEGHDLVQDLQFVHYLASRTKFRRLQDDFYDCGRWLRHFKQFTGHGSSDAGALDNILVRCKDRLRVIEESRDPRCPDYLIRRATDFVEKQVDRLANTEILVAGRHMDFGPWNTLTNSSGVTVIDFFGYRKDPVPVEIMNVLVYLESISHNIANSAFRIQALRQRFLAGFGRLPEAPEPLMLLCEAMQRIRSIAGSVIMRTGTASSRPIGLPERWERSRALQAHAKWFVSRTETPSLWPH